MRLYLIRHGETEYNKTGLVQGHSAVPLNATGIDQATRLAKRMRDETTLDHVYASDLRRTAMTAEILVEYTGTSLSFEPLFRERDPGDLSNKTFEEAIAFFTDLDYEPPNGESVPVFVDRVRRAIDHLLELEGNASRHIALVTHGMFCRAFMQLCLGRDPSEIEAWPNTSLTIVDYTGNGEWNVVLLADASHLESPGPETHATGA